MSDLEAKNRIVSILSTKSLTASELKSQLALTDPLFNHLLCELITERLIRYTGGTGDENFYELTDAGKSHTQPDNGTGTEPASTGKRSEAFITL